MAMLLPGEVVPLPRMIRPDSVTVGKDYVYITDFPTVYIFNGKDFSLVKKFGRSGEGPQEFLQFAGVFIRGDDLFVCDYVKALIYTKEGKYKKEIRARNYIWRELMPVGDKFIGKGRFIEDKIEYVSLNLYDAALNHEKQVLKYQFWGAGYLGKMNNIVDYRNIQYIPYKGNIFVKPEEKNFIIDVYDKSGKRLYRIQRDYEKIPVTEVDIKRYHDYFRTYSKVRRNYEQLKKKLGFYKVFPAIQTFTIADDKIYVVTYKRKEGDSEVFELNLKGKLLKTVFLPLFKTDELFFRSIDNNIFRRINNSTFAVKDGKLYQIIANEEDESWELHVTDIE
jgi:hypothetical protein